MSVIDKNMYEKLKGWSDRERPKNQFMMYVNSRDRALTDMTARKLMCQLEEEDKMGELYISLYSAKTFYRKMRDYFSHISELYMHEPKEDDPLESIIDVYPPTCGWIKLIVEDVEALSNDEMREFLNCVMTFAARRADVILIGNGDYKDVFSGCEYALREMEDGFAAKVEENRLMIGTYDQEAAPTLETLVYETPEQQRDDLHFYWSTIYEGLEDHYFDYETFKAVYKDTLEYIVPRVTKEMVYRKDLNLIEDIGRMQHVELKKHEEIEGCRRWEFDAARKFAIGLHRALVNRLGNHDVFSCEIEIYVRIEEREENHGCITISGSFEEGVNLRVDTVCQEMDAIAETILASTYKGDKTQFWKYLKKKHGGDEDADKIEEFGNRFGSLMEGVKEAADKTVNKDPGKKVRRYKGDQEEAEDGDT